MKVICISLEHSWHRGFLCCTVGYGRRMNKWPGTHSITGVSTYLNSFSVVDFVAAVCFGGHFVCFGWDRISLCSPCWPGVPKNSPDSASWVLGFWAWVTMPSGHLFLIIFSQDFLFYRWKKHSHKCTSNTNNKLVLKLIFLAKPNTAPIRR